MAGVPELAAAQFAALPVMRQLHEILWYLAEAALLPAASRVAGAVEAVRQRTEALRQLSADELADLDVAAHRREVGDLLDRVSDLARRDRPGRDHLSGCLFLTQPQVTAARGDMSTRLPVALTRPMPWT